MRRITNEQFIQQAQEAHNGIYTYERCAYTISRNKVTVTCKEHGDFEMLPTNHVSKKSGCPICAVKVRGYNQRLTTEEFIERSKKVHGEEYNYDNTVVKISSEKVAIMCKYHGEFKVLPFDHMYGVHCPNCSRNGCGKINKKNKSIIYYVYLKYANRYKIGITGSDVSRRFRSEKSKRDIEVIYTAEVSTGALAYLVEQQIIKDYYTLLSKDKTKYMHTGNTELFEIDIFNGDYSIIDAYITRISNDDQQ